MEYQSIERYYFSSILCSYHTPLFFREQFYSLIHFIFMNFKTVFFFFFDVTSASVHEEKCKPIFIFIIYIIIIYLYIISSFHFKPIIFYELTQNKHDFPSFFSAIIENILYILKSMYIASARTVRVGTSTDRL